MARKGLRTRNTRRTFTTENAPELETPEEINLLFAASSKIHEFVIPYLKDIEMRDEQTTNRSSRLNADRQNAPSCMIKP